MRSLLYLMANALLVVSGSQPGLAQARVSKLQTTIGAYAKEHDFNGTILIQDKGKTIYHRSFGVADRAFSVPAANATRYKIASITKAFTSVLILQLYEQGKLDLNGTIGTYLPNYTGEGADRITVHNLLTHTSGMRNMDTVTSYQEGFKNGIQHYQTPYTTDELLTRFASRRLVSEVGKVFNYNNGEYIILGKIIEKLTGKSYEEALKERILQPLGMRESGMLYQRDIVKNLAPTYFLRDDLKVMINDLPAYIDNWYAAGAMYSTSADIARFANALFGSKLLKRETLSLMLKPGLDDYGYGLWIRSIKIGRKEYRTAERYGSIMGANTLLFHLLDSDRTFVFLSNTNTTDLGEFAVRVTRALIN
ncbi:MAG: beta-lactamase family protein [Anaerolineae bacterium]|nr:beta-lactamase family protein [Gemmatimonadaceae bacterium]